MFLKAFINHKCTITSLTAFQVSKMGLMTFLAQLVSFKSKVIEGSHKGKNNMFFQTVHF